ncbi:MAG: TonB-dependent receptor [Acidobacteria bacterium]|nr:TonB-dependent receptor [Acidobacteriota bacterium]
MRLFRFSPTILLVILTFVLSLFLQAQTITGTISGDVTDSTGAVVAGATVTVQNIGTGETRTATTTSTGSYRIPDLSIGKYKVTTGAQGFKSVTRTAEVATGAVTHSDFALQVGQRSEVVEVEGSAPLVDLSPNNNNYVDSEKIANVPINGRDFNSLLAITPGVQRAPGGGFLAVSINGSRTTANNYFIDGMYNNDRYYGDSAIGQTGVVGIPATIFPPEAIEELTVQGTPSSEFGVKGGAPILLGMKSGTNSWHGSATWIRHSGFGDAANYFSNHVTDGCAAPGECKPTQIHNNQFNGTIGGPLIKDKAFFFLYYEGQRYKSLAVSSRLVPTQAQIDGAKQDILDNGLEINPTGQALLDFFPVRDNGLLIAQTPTSAKADGFGVKFDYKFSPTNSVAVRYIFGDSFQSAPAFAGLPAGGNNPADLFNSVAPSRAQMAGLSWTWNLSNNKILESRLGFTRFAQILDVNNKINPADLGLDTGPLTPGDYGVPYVYLLGLGYGGYIGGVQGYPLTTRPDQTWDWSEHFSWVKGNHTIKFGGNFQRAFTNSLRNNARTGMTLGYFTYYTSISGDPVQDEIEQLLLGKADNANRAFGDTHRYLAQNSVGFYAQDDWKIKPRLTLNYGLRYEINGSLYDRKNQASNFFPDRGLVQVGQGIDRLYNVDHGDFGPHVGFSWDIFGSGKSALRGGYSLSYDVPNFGAIASPYSFARARAGAFTQSNLGIFSVSITGDVANCVYACQDPPVSSPPPTAGNCFDPVSGAGDYLCFNQGPLFGPSPSGSPPFNAFSIVQNFKTPRSHNYNLSLQQQISRNNVLTVGYSGQRGQNLVLYRDMNASPIGGDGTRPFDNVFFGEDGTPDFRHIIQATNLRYSRYDSMQVSFNQRGWHGLDTQYNLTWSKCFDTNSVNRGGAGDYPQINNDGTSRMVNVDDNRGLCDHDVRLNFNVGGVYAMPQIPMVGERLGKGWQMSTIFTAIGGRPFTVLLGGGGDPSGQGLTGSAIRASWDGTPVQYNTRNPDQYVVENFTAYDQLDPCGREGSPDPDNPGHFFGGQSLSPFFVPCAGTVGTSRRNQLKGPGLAQWDMTLAKVTKISEKVSLEFRWEVFNVLNRANFHYFPDNTLGSSFGTITKTSDVASGNPVVAQGGPRNMNFGLKLIF